MIKVFKYFHTQFQEIKTPSSLKLSVKAFEFFYNTNFNKHAQIVKVQTPCSQLKNSSLMGFNFMGSKTKRKSSPG